MSPTKDFVLLIVDDNEMNRDLLERHLKHQGYGKTRMAVDGQQAIEILNAEKIDLVLLDIMMPVINGYEVLEYLKADLHLRHIPVIMISALDEVDRIAACIELGAEDYLTKPYNRTILKARISASLEKKCLRDQETFNRLKLEEAYKELGEAYKELEEVKNKLELMTRQDGLTGIANRSYFDRTLIREWKTSVRNQEFFSLIIFDIDFFKQFNDTYGHLVGDECLRKVAMVAERTICRPRDVAARYGGEEFAVILPDTSADGAMLIAQKLCDSVEALEIPHALSKVSKYVTISIGVTTNIAYQTSSSDQMIGNADKALYQAKREGRNRVVVCSDQPLVIRELA
ncbi:diguanylate cyclase [Tumidithrix elongata RA019]|uniref:Diguanylate cyclase n=1 Tax=Tumidithrix elongata BACA0141 TaxID=2716417 RepID=A0AAW9PWX1_9CYAN|nr:diguanylate cyclase [Tumidithrix elongata RA019]